MVGNGLVTRSTIDCFETPTTWQRNKWTLTTTWVSIAVYTQRHTCSTRSLQHGFLRPYIPGNMQCSHKMWQPRTPAKRRSTVPHQCRGLVDTAFQESCLSFSHAVYTQRRNSTQSLQHGSWHPQLDRETSGHTPHGSPLLCIPSATHACSTAQCTVTNSILSILFSCNVLFAEETPITLQWGNPHAWIIFVALAWWGKGLNSMHWGGERVDAELNVLQGEKRKFTVCMKRTRCWMRNLQSIRSKKRTLWGKIPMKLNHWKNWGLNMYDYESSWTWNRGDPESLRRIAWGV